MSSEQCGSTDLHDCHHDCDCFWCRVSRRRHRRRASRSSLTGVCDSITETQEVKRAGEHPVDQEEHAQVIRENEHLRSENAALVEHNNAET